LPAGTYMPRSSLEPVQNTQRKSGSQVLQLSFPVEADHSIGHDDEVRTVVLLELSTDMPAAPSLAHQDRQQIAQRKHCKKSARKAWAAVHVKHRAAVLGMILISCAGNSTGSDVPTAKPPAVFVRSESSQPWINAAPHRTEWDGYC